LFVDGRRDSGLKPGVNETRTRWATAEAIGEDKVTLELRHGERGEDEDEEERTS
jgi:hypothetical protein